MDFLNELGILTGTVSVLGILSATIYTAIATRAARLSAEKAEEHAKAVRRDVRLIAVTTLKIREEAKRDGARSQPPLAKRLAQSPLEEPTPDATAPSVPSPRITLPKVPLRSGPIIRRKLELPRLTPRSEGECAGQSFNSPRSRFAPKASSQKKKSKKRKQPKTAKS